jgi:hypothetical protein
MPIRGRLVSVLTTTLVCGLCGLGLAHAIADWRFNFWVIGAVAALIGLVAASVVALLSADLRAPPFEIRAEERWPLKLFAYALCCGLIGGTAGQLISPVLATVLAAAAFVVGAVGFLWLVFVRAQVLLRRLTNGSSGP